MAYLGLADAVDATEPLLQSVRVPRQVVVDHQVCAALEVHALTRGIVRDQNPQIGIVVERGNDRPSSIAGHATVDHRHRLRPADPLRDTFSEVVQRVLGFREDQQLAARPRHVVNHRRLVEDGAELRPFRVLTGLEQTIRQMAPDEPRAAGDQIMHG